MLKRISDLRKSEFYNNSFRALLLRVTGIIFQFATLMLITNVFLDKTVGQFNYINAVLILLSSICLLGMNESFIQFSGKLEAKNMEGNIRALYFKKIKILLGSFVVFTIIYLFLSRVLKISFFSPNNIFLYDKIFFALLFLSFTLLNIQVIRAMRELFRSELFRNVVRYGLILLCILIVLVFNLPEELILNSFLVTFFLIALITTIYIFRHTSEPKRKAENFGFSYGEIIKTSFPMSLSFISLLLMQSFDVIMLEHYMDIETVAYYTVSVKLTFIVGIMLQTINSVIAPDISKFWFQRDMPSLNRLINKAIRLNFIISLPLIVLMILFHEYILDLFGANYYKGKTALLILLIGQAVNSLSGSVALYLNMTGRQKILLLFLIVSAVLNIILNIILIPLYGMTGAAISTAFSLILWNFSGVVYIYINDKILLLVNPNTFKKSN